MDTYTTWTSTSSTYQAYQQATARCETVFELRAIVVRIVECHRRERELTGPLDKRTRRHIRWEREALELKHRELKLSLRTPEQVAADADAKRRAQEAEIAAEHRAILEAERGPLATGPQIRLIVQLIKRRRINGDGGGWFDGPTDVREIEQMTRVAASAYIDSLKDAC